MSWLLLPLHDSLAVNVATVALATIIGLAGYHGLVGQPAGFPRQLLGALSVGLLFGSATFVYDAHAHLVFSTTIRELLTLPTGMLPASWPAALYFGILGFSLGLTPSLRALISVAQGAALPIASRVVTTVWAILVQSLTFTLAMQVALVKLHLFAPFRPPLWAVVVLAVLFVVLRRLYRLSRYTLLQRLRAELDSMSKQTDEDARFWRWVVKWVSLLISVFAGGLLFSLPIAVAGLALWVYFVSLLGWSLLLYVAVLLALYLTWRLIQYAAEHLPRRTLRIIALVLFLVAAGLQVYQALAV